MRMWIPALVLGLWVIFALDTVVWGQSSPRPPVFGGIVTIDGAAAPEGAEVTAWIDGAQVASATITNGTYAFVIAQPPGSLFEGKSIKFLVNGIAAYQSGIWESDGGSELNLTAGPIAVVPRDVGGGAAAGAFIGGVATTDTIGELAVTDLAAATSFIADLGASPTQTQQAAAVDIIGDLAVSAVEARQNAAVDIIGDLAVSGVAAQQTAAANIIGNLPVSAAVDIIGDLAVSGVGAQQTAAVDIIGGLAVSGVATKQTAAVDIIGDLAVSAVEAQQTAAANIIGDLAFSAVKAQHTAAVEIIGKLAVSTDLVQQDAAANIITDLATSTDLIQQYAGVRTITDLAITAETAAVGIIGNLSAAATAATANLIPPDLFAVVGASTTVAIANSMAPDDFTQLVSEQLEVMATTVTPDGFRTLGADRVGGIMDGLQIAQIEGLDTARKEAVLEALDADYLGVGVVEFDEAIAAPATAQTTFGITPEAVGISLPTTKSVALSFFQAWDLFGNGPGSVTVDKTTASHGETVKVSLAEYAASDTVTSVKFGCLEASAQLTASQLTVSSSGTLTMTLTVPATTPLGTQQIAVLATTEGSTARTTTIQITGAPVTESQSPGASISINPTSAKSGNTIVVCGTDFPKFVSVTTLTIGATAALPSPSPATNTNGNFTASVLVPGLSVGTQAVVVTAGGVTANAPLTLEPAAATTPVTTNTTEEVFADVIAADNLVRVWRFNNTDKSWSFYDPHWEFSTLTDASSGDIVWVNVNSEQEFQGQTLAPGWNLISLN